MTVSFFLHLAVNRLSATENRVITDLKKIKFSIFSKIFGMPEDQMKEHPHALFGSEEEICDELERRREIFGISYVTVGNDNLESFAPVVKKLTGK